MAEEHLIREVAEISQTMKDVCRRVTKIEDDYGGVATQLTNLTTSNALILKGQEIMQETLKGLDVRYSEVNKRQQKHELKPSEYWTKLMWTIGTIIVTAIMTLVVAKIGLN